MSSSPPSSRLETPRSTTQELAPTRSGRQRKSVQKFGSMMDSDRIIDYMSDHSGDELFEVDAENEREDQDEESYGKEQHMEEDDEDDEGGTEGDDEEDEFKVNKKSKKAGSTSKQLKAIKSSKKGASSNLVDGKAKKASKPVTLLPKSAGKKRPAPKPASDGEEDADGSDVATKVGGSSAPASSVSTASKPGTKRISVKIIPAKRSLSPVPSDGEESSNQKEKEAADGSDAEQDEKEQDEERHSSPNAPFVLTRQAPESATPQSSPPPPKKTKVAPTQATLAFPKTATKAGAAPAKKLTAARINKMDKDQPKKPAPKGRGGGLQLAKKIDSTAEVIPTTGKNTGATKKGGDAAKAGKKAGGQKKAEKANKAEDMAGSDIEMGEDAVDEETTVGADPDEKANPPVSEQQPTKVPVKIGKKKVTAKRATKKAAGDTAPKVTAKSNFRPAAGSDTSADEEGGRQRDSNETGNSKATKDDTEEEEEVEEKKPKKAAVSKKASKSVRSASDKSTSTKRTTSNDSQVRKLAPAEKVNPAARVAIIEAFSAAAYTKGVDFKSIASSFNDDPDSSKLSRHWREVLSSDLIDYFRGTSSKKATKPAAKGGLGKDHRLAIWHGVCKNYDKADWEKVSEVADGMSTTKLKRHFRDVMEKEVKKFISSV